MHSPRRTLLFLAALLLSRVILPAAEEVVSISSVVFNGYARTRQPDGKFAPEFYVFGEGGRWTRPIDDPAMDRLQFPQIAHLVAGPLARMNYRPAPDPRQAGLLILVFWGSTLGSHGQDSSDALHQAATAIGKYSSSVGGQETASGVKDAVNTNSPEGAALDAALWQLSVANAERDRLDDRNARILGYGEALDRARSMPHMSAGQDVVQELGGNRYYVVLQAYDNRTVREQKKLKPLWTTRLSVSESGDFAEALARMVTTGAPLFGQDSDGLRRNQTREGIVKLGPLEVLETVPPK